MSGPPDLIDRVVAISSELELERVPADVEELAGIVVADSVAIASVGAREPEMVSLVQLLAQQDLVGTGGATILGHTQARTNAPTAAFLNGTSGTFSALDSVAAGTGHPAMHVVPAAVAAAEVGHASGQSLLEGVIIGYEVAARLHQVFLIRPPAHPNGHLGAIGAAAAVARILNRDPVSCARIAGTVPLLTIRRACYEGATARNVWFGLAAQSAVMAAFLDEAGFLGSSSAAGTAFGDIVGKWGDPQTALASLDYQKLAVTRNLFKRHAACYGVHLALDAVAEMDLPSPRALRKITVEVPDLDNTKVNNGLPLHANMLAAQFSLPYAVATAVATGST
ncbi:MAG: MmgE/PrpD family protein, partial [Acidimicrobiales bacterium]